MIRTRLAGTPRSGAAFSVLRWAWESGVTVLGTSEEDHQRATTLLEQCVDLPLSYFDGLLMAVAERREVSELITVDGAHFRGIRLAHSPVVTVV